MADLKCSPEIQHKVSKVGVAGGPIGGRDGQGVFKWLQLNTKLCPAQMLKLPWIPKHLAFGKIGLWTLDSVSMRSLCFFLDPGSRKKYRSWIRIHKYSKILDPPLAQNVVLSNTASLPWPFCLDNSDPTATEPAPVHLSWPSPRPLSDPLPSPSPVLVSSPTTESDLSYPVKWTSPHTNVDRIATWWPVLRRGRYLLNQPRRGERVYMTNQNSILHLGDGSVCWLGIGWERIVLQYTRTFICIFSFD